MMNLIGGWFGAMPVCHGSGGLAAQYRFGARSGASIIMLGSFKILLGLFFGEELISLLHSYPKGLLGIMVLAAGLELAKVGESLNHGARDLWEVLDSRSSNNNGNGEGSGPNGSKQQRQLSDEERMERWTVMFMTVGFLLAFKNDGVGFLAGMLCHAFYHGQAVWDATAGFGIDYLVKAWDNWVGIDDWERQRLSRGGAGRSRSRQATTVEEEEGLLSEAN